MQKKTVLSEDFPKRLKQLRLNRGWSQGQLGQKIGIEYNRISKYERGMLWPSLELLVKIANVFDVSLDYLIRDAEELVINKMSNKDLLQRVEEADGLSEEAQKALIMVLDAFIIKHKVDQLAQR